jgi:putative membrane protein
MKIAKVLSGWLSETVFLVVEHAFLLVLITSSYLIMKPINLRGLISTGVGILSFAALSSTLPVLAQNSPTQGGSMQDAPTQGGSMQNSPMQDGSMQQSPAQGGSMQQSPAQGGSMQQSPAQDGSMQQSTPNSSNRNSSLSAVDRQFMMKAAQSDMTEIRTSQLALSRSQNPQVRQFAQQMIQHHTQSSSKLKPLAAQKGVTLPKDLGENQALLTQLTKLSGTQFDQAYLSGQVKAHSKTQALYQKELQQGKDPAVKAFASQMLPVVTAHLRMAQNMVAGR